MSWLWRSKKIDLDDIKITGRKLLQENKLDEALAFYTDAYKNSMSDPTMRGAGIEMAIILVLKVNKLLSDSSTINYKQQSEAKRLFLEAIKIYQDIIENIDIVKEPYNTNIKASAYNNLAFLKTTGIAFVYTQPSVVEGGGEGGVAQSPDDSRLLTPKEATDKARLLVGEYKVKKFLVEPDLSEAIVNYRMAIEINPNDISAILNLGGVLYLEWMLSAGKDEKYVNNLILDARECYFSLLKKELTDADRSYVDKKLTEIDKIIARDVTYSEEKADKFGLTKRKGGKSRNRINKSKTRRNKSRKIKKRIRTKKIK